MTPLILLSAAASLHAATITVTNTNDSLAGSLRQAILNAQPNDTIVFAIPTTDPGYNALTKVYTIGLTSMGLDINKNLSISGVGTRIVVRRNVAAPFSIFTVIASVGVSIDNLTIANGSAEYGGGIFNDNGSLSLNNCTLTGNQATDIGGGGGLFNANIATIRNCTFTTNQAPAGGAILSVGTILLTNSTVSGNTGTDTAGGIYSNPGAITEVGNTIVADNSGGTEPDVFGAFVSDDYNFIGAFNGSSGFDQAHDQVGTFIEPADPNLGLLGDHGGDTATMVPLLGSPVIDQGKSDQALLDFDQRGFSRPANQAGVVDVADGDGSDIGAVELGEYQPGPDLTVDAIEDHDNGVCQMIGCSLREALNAANQAAGASTISFAPALAGMTLTNALTSTGLVITQSVTINGPGARRLTISGGAANRCLQVTGGTVVINGLTFAHGLSSSGAPGGAIQNTNGATLTLNDCTFADNTVTDFGVGVEYGGGVAQLNAGVLNVNRCTFADNTAGSGGALGNFDGTVVVTNSTFTGNSAPRGGAIASTSFSVPTASLDLRSSTVVGNEATFGGNGGGVTQLGSTVTVTNSIIGGNTSTGTAPNVSGDFDSQGYNVIGDAGGATGFTNGAREDQVGVLDLKVGIFGSHGGQTDTIPLLVGSVAINKAATTAPERDQRGYVREDAADVGAFEFGGTIPVTLANISTRLSVETGDNVLIGGFIVTGTEAKKVLIRAIGPSLPVAGKLANPTLELYDAGGLLLSNDDWKSTQQAEIEATTIPPTNDLESAIVTTLPANNSAYTAIVRGVNNTTGVGLVEVYDLDRTVDSKLANISTRGFVQTGDDVVIGGLIVLGTDPQDVIVRAIGPSLPVAGALLDPTLELHNANGALLASNDNWRSDQEAEIIASTVAPTNDLESAIVRTLAPASYTAIVRGARNSTGIALVEVFGLN